MHHELHTEIDAAPELVWQVLIDLDRYPDWNTAVAVTAGSTPTLAPMPNWRLARVAR